MLENASSQEISLCTFQTGGGREGGGREGEGGGEGGRNSKHIIHTSPHTHLAPLHTIAAEVREEAEAIRSSDTVGEGL